MDIKGTQSEKNVIAAFAGESQARNKYTYYAAQAKSEGNLIVADLFEKMADNEKEHAKLWFKIINNGFSDTYHHLASSADGEHYECSKMYPEFARQAREDGFEQLAVMFEKVSEIESDHERRFLEAAVSYKAGTMTDYIPNEVKIKKNKPFRCAFCGATADERLDVCPVCEAIGSFESVK